MTSSRRMFLAFAAALAGIALAMGWVTWQAIELERREREARAESQQQESIRLSLWRMDSLLTAILARESARPYFEFQPFYPAQRAYTRMFEPVQPGEVLVPSPLLAGGDDLVRLYFQLNPDGRLTSPQSPAGNMRDLAESAYVEPDSIIRAEAHLEALSSLGISAHLEQPAPSSAGRGHAFNRRELESEHRDQSLASTPQYAQSPQVQQSQSLESQTAQTTEEYAARQRQAELSNRPQSRISPPAQIVRAPGSPPRPAADSAADDRQAAEKSAERIAGKPAEPPEEKVIDKLAFDQSGRFAAARKDTLKEAGQQIGALQAPIALGQPLDTLASAPGGDLEQGPFHAVWVRPPGQTAPPRSDLELLLIRRVELQSQELHQGLWLDWPAVRERLLASVSDLLPQARLEPIPETRPASPDEVGRLLATIPVRLVPGPPPRLPVSWWTPRRATLLLSWIAMIGAGLTVFSVLRASIALSERRGRFVSAVTHELRTPLTTFCLYSQMLADGMVTDEEARRQYLTTLKSESRRLARVVEDVLDYARLSRPKPRRRPDPIPAADLLAQCLPELRRRAQRASLDLVEETADLGPSGGPRLTADARSVERILLNLVDNACKYADGPDRRLHLRTRIEPGRVIFQVADHGPGIPDGDAARIFHPFERGRSAEHQSEPGLGLGLALSRGLAAELGGELRLIRAEGFGAIFELSLPGR
ncbi:MAG: hypothetical protein IT436_16750 [Phycisphaerales bacterium]|nr:hypothetical protein [Phycisphaerales bacterium]